MTPAFVLCALFVFGSPVSSAASEVIAELAFRDELPDYGPVGDGQIAIDIALPGRRPLPLLLDTAARRSALTRRYARALRVPDRGEESDAYRVETTLGRELALVVDEAQGARAGRLGADFLESSFLEIDYVDRTVLFLSRHGARVRERNADPAEIRVPIGLVDGRPIVEIELGAGSAWFVVDTASAHALRISERTALELGIAGSADAEVALPIARIGGQGVADVELEVSRGSGEARVGNAFLSRFRTFIDYPNRRMRLIPRDARAASPQATPRDPRLARNAAIPDPAGRVRAARSGSPQVWLHVGTPAAASSAHAGPVALLEVSGWAGEGAPGEHDVAVVVDVSGSTAIASGFDVDGDGKLGRAKRRESWRNFNPRWLSSDPDDTILAAELVATNRLVGLLDPERTRISIVSFHGAARLHAPLGSSPELIAEALAELDGSFGSGMTNLAEATSTAASELLADRRDERHERKGERSILILSDGYPTAPGSEEHAADASIEAARSAALAGIRIYTFALGVEDPEETERADVFGEMARLSGGAHVQLDNPGEVVNALPRIDLARVAAVEMRNVTMGTPGRAVRVFPDGSFDGYVRLAPGENTIEIVARGDGGGERRLDRQVHFEKHAPRDALEAAEFDASLRRLRESLRARSQETELAIRAQGRREAGELLRDLRIEMEDEE